MKRHVTSAALIVAATVFVFAQVRNFEFINLDDQIYVAQNTRIGDGWTLDNVHWAFTTTYFANWHPIVWLSYFVDDELFGEDPGGFHTTNLMIHIANALLVYVVLFRMTGALAQSMLVAILFAIHPLHVEPVAWISSRKDLLSAFFGFLSILAYVQYTRRGSFFWFVMSLLVFTCSLMSKQMLVTLPFLLIVFDVWPLQRARFPRCETGEQTSEFDVQPWRRIFLEKTPFLLLAFVFCGIAVAAQKTEGNLASLAEIPFATRIANAVVVYTLYMFKTIWPAKLSVYYPYPREAYSVMSIAISASLLIGISIVAARLCRWRPSLFMGWLWFLGMLVPVIGIVQIGNQQMADRYTYIPLIGLFISLVWTAVPLSRFRPITYVCFTVVVILCAVCSWRQTAHWKNSHDLFSHAVSVTSNNSVAHNNLGNALLHDLNQPRNAIPHFERAIEIDPRHVKAQVNLGNALHQIGDFDGAVEQFELALKTDRRRAQAHYYAHYHLGLTLQRQGKHARAVRHFEEFVKSAPLHAKAHNNLATSLHACGRHDEALQHFQKATNLDPENPGIRINLGTALHVNGRLRDAIACYQEVIRIAPAYASAHLSLARAYWDAKDRRLARTHFKTAIELSPQNAEFHDEFGSFLLELGDVEAAIHEFEAALRIRPDFEAYSQNLNRALLKRTE